MVVWGRKAVPCTHYHIPHHTNKKPFLCAPCSAEMIHRDIDKAWQWRANPFKGRDRGAGCVKAPSVQFRSWNAEDNCPGKGSPTPAENACSELTFLISLPAEIKFSSSGSLLGHPFSQRCSSFTTGSQMFQTVTQFCSQIPLFPPCLTHMRTHAHTHTRLWWLMLHTCHLSKVYTKQRI